MDITLGDVDSVLDTSSPTKLAQVFSKLLDPTQGHVFLLKYTDAILARFDIRPEAEAAGLSVFGKACVSAGIVKTVSELVKLYPPSRPYHKETYIALYRAFVILFYLFYTADTTVERHTLIEQLLTHDLYGAIVQTLDHPLCSLQFVTVDIIIATAYMLPENLTTRLTPKVVAGILFGLCQLALEGPKRIKEQLNSPALVWIRELPWKIGIQNPRSPVDIDRYLARFQECIILTASRFLRAYRPFACQIHLEIIKSNPQLLDVLFDCAIIPRPTLFPTTMACAQACEILTLLFLSPPYIVPGVPTPMDTMLEMPWKSISQCLTILTSRHDWAEKIIDTWMTVEEEELLRIRIMLQKDPPWNSLMGSVDRANFLVAEHRGLIRIAILRLISTLTHAAESCGVTNAEVQSLLRIAYTACHKIPPKDECKTNLDHISRVERTISAEESSIVIKQYNHPTALFKIGNERVLGPIALARLLVVLAQRKALDTIQELKKPPKGLSSSTSLHHVQQITHPVVIQRFLTIALQRVVECTEKGQSSVTERQYSTAQNWFISSAELAGALVAFDTHTEGRYINHVRGARKELVIALFNVSAAALKEKAYLEAKSFALAAIHAAESVPAEEGLDRNIVKECRLRVQEIL